MPTINRLARKAARMIPMVLTRLRLGYIGVYDRVLVEVHVDHEWSRPTLAIDVDSLDAV